MFRILTQWKAVFCLSLFFSLLFGSLTSEAQSLIKGRKTNQNPQSQPQSVRSVDDIKDQVLHDTIFKDQSGTWMRKVKYASGTETTMILPPPVGERSPIDMDTINKDSIVVVVEKEFNVIYILHKRKRIRQYRAVFGPDKMRDKHKEGDRCTPEGWFKIVQIRNHKEWQKFLLLDYPTPESYERFNARMKSGEIGPNARIGSAIGIHGTFKGGDDMVDMGFGWTDGCVALKSTDIHDFTQFVQEGTRVYITKRTRAVQRRKS